MEIFALNQARESAPLSPNSAGRGDPSPAPRTIYTERLRADIQTLRSRGVVPLAIARILNVQLATVARHLRKLEAEGKIEPTPSYLTLSD
jgi:DNA invertase Pin-like site-specific DNA recombinase